MSLTGTGVIAIWHDISAEGLEDFYEWHNREHIPERVGIDGFLRGRRYIVAQGEPDFFTLYNVHDAGVLSGAAYHARLNDPTPWTLKAVTYFSNEYRSLCEVKASQGVGSGGLIGTIRFDCDVGRDASVLAPTPGSRLTLVTCWPFDAPLPGGRQRYVAVAEARAQAISSTRAGVEPAARASRRSAVTSGASSSSASARYRQS